MNENGLVQIYTSCTGLVVFNFVLFYNLTKNSYLINTRFETISRKIKKDGKLFRNR